MTSNTDQIDRVRKMGSARIIGSAACVLAAVSMASLVPAQAEPVTDRILAGSQIITRDGCILLKVNFNIRIRYVSHFPLNRGDELRIVVRPIDPAQAAAELLTARESARPPANRAIPIKAIDFEAGRGEGSTLRLQFNGPVDYQVGPGADFESVVIALADPKSRKACAPVVPLGASGTWNTTVVPESAQPGLGSRASAATLPSRARDRATGPIGVADLKAAGAAMDEGRAALKKQDYETAARLLIKVLRYPENQYSSDAQELLGIVYQKNKQHADAKAEYEDYLRRYPKAEGAESVSQRLAAIETAQMSREENLRAAKQSGRTGDGGPGQTTWTVSGSASQFYVRDDSFRIVRDPSLPPILNADKEDHRVHRNAVLSSLDIFATWNNDLVKSKIRLSGTEEHRFNGDGEDILGVSALYWETAFKQSGVLGRIGRQTRNTGGVLGRFDGGLVSWQTHPWLKWNVVAGSPVASRRDEPFKDEKIFYGGSVDFGPFFGGLDVSVFAIHQQVGDIIDRQAIGTELRYLDQTRSAFLTLDYDTHFQEFNAAIASGSWTLFDKSMLHAGVDYRKAPYLTSWNALQGQQMPTLFELLKLRTREEVTQMAIDRTATYQSVNLGYSRPLSEKLQISFDVTAAHIDGTITSFGVDALPSTGTEIYYSTRLIGTSLISEGDMFTAAARYADRQESHAYALDFGVRYPLTRDWRVNPRLLLAYREGKNSDLVEYTVLPSILLDYNLTKDLAFEFEVGAKRTWREEAGIHDDDTELFFTVGLRYDFYTDGKWGCPASAPKCR